LITLYVSCCTRTAWRITEISAARAHVGLAVIAFDRTTGILKAAVVSHLMDPGSQGIGSYGQISLKRPDITLHIGTGAQWAVEGEILIVKARFVWLINRWGHSFGSSV